MREARSPFSVAGLVLAAALGMCGLLAVLAAPEARGDAPPSLPGPAPRARADGHDVGQENASCEGCHTDIAREWRSSLHRQAWTDPVFQEAYAIEPMAFCRSCHAPESDASAEPTTAAQSVGVGCTTCHVQDGAIVGKRGLAKTDSRHAVLGDARLGTTAACASCHQFDFPRAKGQPMQNTAREHRASAHASTECQGCHMPERIAPDGKRHVDHAFAVLSDPSMIQSAARVTAKRVGPDALELTLAPGRVGHAFPTGDMFRRLELRAEVVDARGTVVARAEPVHLARVFADRGRVSGEAGLVRAQIADTRVLASPRVAVLRFGEPVAGRTVRWLVAYQRMDHAMAASFGVDAARDEILVARGEVTSPPTEQAKEQP